MRSAAVTGRNPRCHLLGFLSVQGTLTGPFTFGSPAVIAPPTALFEVLPELLFLLISFDMLRLYSREFILSTGFSKKL